MDLSASPGVLHAAIERVIMTRRSVLVSHVEKPGVGNATKEKNSTMTERWDPFVLFKRTDEKVSIDFGTHGKLTTLSSLLLH